jgi:hypothetical protein
VQTAPAGAGVVDTSAGLRAAVRTPRRTAATSPSAVGRANAAAMGRRRPALGLGRDLEAHFALCSKQIHNLRTPRKILANGLLAVRPRRRLGCNVLKFSKTG